MGIQRRIFAAQREPVNGLCPTGTSPRIQAAKFSKDSQPVAVQSSSRLTREDGHVLGRQTHRICNNYADSMTARVVS